MPDSWICSCVSDSCIDSHTCCHLCRPVLEHCQASNSQEIHDMEGFTGNHGYTMGELFRSRVNM